MALPVPGHRPGWQLGRHHAQRNIEGCPKLGIPVVDQEVDSGLTFLKLPHHQPGLLGDQATSGFVVQAW